MILPLLFLAAGASADTLIAHDVQLDSAGKLAPWTSLGEVTRLAWHALERVPLQADGLPTYFTYSRFEPATFAGIFWAHNPAGLTAMLTDAALPWYAYSGELRALDVPRGMLEYILAHGMTEASDSWASVPYSSSDGGAHEYRGGDDTRYCWQGESCGRGDGVGFLEPDKVGEIGYAFARFYEVSGDRRYLRAAESCGRALAVHVRVGDETHSPWPFRVDARTGLNVREQYSADAVGPIRLLDELARLGHATSAMKRAREVAWSWVLRVPMTNGNWSGYFEDIPIHENPAENLNQYDAVETARYLLENPGADPAWRMHAHELLDWTAEHFAVDFTSSFGLEKGLQWGAEALSEQNDDMAKMGSHTSRFAEAQALYAEKTGDASARERAWRSFAWASYACDSEGVVKVGTNDGEGYWFSDGYGDYLRHFERGMASVPDWAPVGENHLLRSSSVIRHVSYRSGCVAYRAFDSHGEELLKLRAKPTHVRGARVESVAAVDGGFAVRLRRVLSRRAEVCAP
jgi:hypothetical protein